VYVRPEAKKAWKTKSGRRILQKGQNVVVVEDLIGK
jgi:orotate phosphoribosyltransferase